MILNTKLYLSSKEDPFSDAKELNSSEASLFIRRYFHIWPDDREKVECLLCGIIFRRRCRPSAKLASVSNLLNHLDTIHSVKFQT